MRVSIPQAVGVVATWHMIHTCFLQRQSFNTVNGKGCCNTAYVQYSVTTSAGFNTASGKYCYFITFVLPSLRSGTCDVWTSSSLCSSAVSHSAAHTVNGRCCCLITFVLPSLRSGTCNVWASSSLRSSAASHSAAHTAGGRCCYNFAVKTAQNGKKYAFQYRRR